MARNRTLYAGADDGGDHPTHVCISPEAVRHAGMKCRWLCEVRDGERGPWRPYQEKVKTMQWIVSTGEYDNYRVLAACRCRTDAYALARKINERSDIFGCGRAYPEAIPEVGADVEPITVHRIDAEVWDAPFVTPADAPPAFRVRPEDCDSTGRVSGYRTQTQQQWPFDLWDNAADPCRWRWVRAPAHQGLGGRIELRGTDIDLMRATYANLISQLTSEGDDLHTKREKRGKA